MGELHYPDAKRKQLLPLAHVIDFAMPVTCESRAELVSKEDTLAKVPQIEGWKADDVAVRGLWRPERPMLFIATVQLFSADGLLLFSGPEGLLSVPFPLVVPTQLPVTIIGAGELYLLCIVRYERAK